MLLKQRVLAHGCHERLTLGKRRCLRQPRRQRAGRRNDAGHYQPVDIAIAKIARCVEGEPHASASDLLDRREAFCEYIGNAIRIDQTRHHFVLQDSTPCRFFSAACCRAESVRGGAVRRPFALGHLVNGWFGGAAS